MRAARGLAGLGLAAVAGAVLAGCSGSGDTTDRSSAPPAAANAGLGAAPAAPSPNITEKVTEAAFRTPSQNIGCYLTAEAARCDIANKSWAPPPKPADCDLDWGNGISVYQDQQAAFTCAGDTVLGEGDVLAYGRSLQAGEFVCDSSRTALSCSNVSSGHGFTLSVQQYDLF